ncbi:MAG: tetraacyldisaccharide 4'-kinase, partial [Gemmatimonadaceae bacterium]
WAFAGAVALRGRLYDRRLLDVGQPSLPALGVGNLTVGGTGKTPIAAELARRLRAAGARPAIVLRGYGDDEPLVHARLNPDVPVVTGADRAAAVRQAAAAGADVAVLDDAFQHRRLARQADIVLLSADRWGRGSRRLLPAGPWREPLAALGRASLAVVTRKAAAPEEVDAAVAAIAAAAPDCPVAVAELALDALVAVADGERRPLSDLRGRAVLAATAIGDPGAFVSQLRASGASVSVMAWPDHHAFTAADVDRLALAAGRADLVVCTLKDAVKLAPRWPRAAAALWYVSQTVAFERGEEQLQPILTALLQARIPLP